MRVLCLDSGSSSLKFAIYDMPAEQLVLSGATEVSGARAQAAALDSALQQASAKGTTFGAVGHRVVFGGPNHGAPERIDQALLEDLDNLVPYDPVHLPPAIATIRRVTELAPNVPQVACFDSSFHRRMPSVARRYPLPSTLGSMVRRYGYHGLSYEYIVSTGAATGRTIIAHLGNGASLAAVRDGQPVDTTMGFSPLGGLMMGTRPGDLDPGVMLYLLRAGGFDLESLTTLLNARSGLLGVSGSTADMRELLQRQESDPAAKQAVELFVYIAVKLVGSLAAALGGLDTLIFTGGIGEHAAPIRKAMCAGCAYLGVELDDDRNGLNAQTLSSNGSKVRVLIVPTNENLMIARHVAATLS